MTSSDLRAKLLAAFESEHRVVLTSIRAYLMARENGQEGSLDEAFRMAHSLKGAARVVDLMGVVSVAHAMETVLAAARAGKLGLQGPALGALHAGLDAIEDLVAASKQGRRPGPPGAVMESLERLLHAGDAAAAVPEPGARPAPAAEASPPAQADTIRLRAEQLDRVLGSASELVGAVRGAEHVREELAPIEQGLDRLERELAMLRRDASRPLQRVQETPGLRPVQRYMDLLEQELRGLGRALRRASREGRQSAWNLRRLGQDLQESVLRARTVPAESVFEALPKMVRDLAAEQGKRISFRATGLDSEADRGVLQALKDPLMHMVRNCAYHGIERPAEREARGKAAEGQVRLELRASGGRLRIALQDDGRGLDLAGIGKVASEQGIDAPAEGLAQLIFRPGFSTASSVSDLAGRGMGLSVAYEAVRRLGGRIRVESAPGLGASFLLEVPSALSSQRVMLVSCGGQRLGIPTHGIEMLRQAREEELRVEAGRQVLVAGAGTGPEAPLPLMHLASLIGMGETRLRIVDGRLPVVVLKSPRGRVAVAVDGVLDEREAVVHELTAPLDRIRHLSGTLALPDGSFALVLDPGELVPAAGSASVARAARPLPARERVPAAAALPRRRRILIVDDSITTRTLEKGILEANGYDVALAVDGVEAMALIRSGEALDLVVSDVEMPRMDGFELVSEIKGDPRHSWLPVIMVTSRENAEDRQRGLALGANRYLAKQKFDQARLLEAIEEVLA